ncbi:hypothetical protein D3C72_1734930 [compost metagenome]
MPQRALDHLGHQITVGAQHQVAEHEERQAAEEPRLFQAAQLQERRAVARFGAHEIGQRRQPRRRVQQQQPAVTEEIVIGPLQGMQQQKAAQSQRRDRHETRLPRHRGRALPARHGDRHGNHRQDSQGGDQPEHQRPSVVFHRHGCEPWRQRRACAQSRGQRLDAVKARRAGRDQVHRQPRRRQHRRAARGHQHAAQQETGLAAG